MQYMLIVLVLSIAANLGGGWLLKNAWQEQAAIEAAAAEKYNKLAGDYQEDTELLEERLNTARNRYAEQLNENYRQQQLLVEKDEAVQNMRRELSASIGRMNEIASQSDPELQECFGMRLPADYARELFGTGAEAGSGQAVHHRDGTGAGMSGTAADSAGESTGAAGDADH